MGQIAKNKFDSMDIYPRGGGTTDSVTCPGHKFQFGAAVFVNNYYGRPLIKGGGKFPTFGS